MNMGQQVTIQASGQTGSVVGYSVLMNSEPQYLVRYKDGTGDAVERWWAQSALVPAVTQAA